MLTLADDLEPTHNSLLATFGITFALAAYIFTS
jgi:hypothetical protein